MADDLPANLIPKQESLDRSSDNRLSPTKLLRSDSPKKQATHGGADAAIRPEGRSPSPDRSPSPGRRSPGKGGRSPPPGARGKRFSQASMVSIQVSVAGGKVNKADKVAQLSQQQQQPDSTPSTIRFFLNLCEDRHVDEFRKGERPAYSQLSEYLQKVFQEFKRLAGKDDLKRSRLHDAVLHCEHGLATLTGRQEKLTTNYFNDGLEACKDARQLLDSFDDVLVVSKIEITLLHFLERNAAARRRQLCMEVMADLMGMREVLDMVTYRVTGRLTFDLLWEKNLPPRLEYVLGCMHWVDAVLQSYLGKRRGPPAVDRKRTTWLGLRLQAELEAHGKDVMGLGECSGGTVLVSGSCDGSLRLWDMTKGVPAVKAELGGREHHVSCVAVDEAARRVYTGGYDALVRVWQAEDGKAVASLSGHRAMVRSIASDAEHQAVYSGAADGEIRVWHTANLLCLLSLPGHTHGVEALAVDAGRRVLYSGSYDQTIRQWGMQLWEKGRASYHCTHTFLGHTDAVEAVAVDPYSERVFSAAADATIRVWSSKDKECILTLQGEMSPVVSLAIDWVGDGAILVWELTKLRQVDQLSMHDSAVTALHVDRTAMRLFSGDRAGRVVLTKI